MLSVHIYKTVSCISLLRGNVHVDVLLEYTLVLVKVLYINETQIKSINYGLTGDETNNGNRKECNNINHKLFAFSSSSTIEHKKVTLLIINSLCPVPL